MPASFSNEVKDYKSKIKKTCQEIKDIYYFIQKIKQQILSFEIDKNMNQILEKKNIFVSTNILAFNSKDNKNNLEEKNRIISKKKIVENNLINKEHKI